VPATVLGGNAEGPRRNKPDLSHALELLHTIVAALGDAEEIVR
jgi:hypothetical protein